MLGLFNRDPRYICDMRKKSIVQDFSLRAKSMGFMFIAGLVCVGLLVSCSNEPSYELSEGFEGAQGERSTARLEVTGMMCAHACGGKIKKELLEIPGVANAAIDFESDRPSNLAIVEFDPEQVNPDDLVKTITGIAEGKLYGVESVEVTHFAKEATLPG